MLYASARSNGDGERQVIGTEWAKLTTKFKHHFTSISNTQKSVLLNFLFYKTGSHLVLEEIHLSDCFSGKDYSTHS